jgi:uncharacterized membrane protein YgcG
MGCKREPTLGGKYPRHMRRSALTAVLIGLLVVLGFAQPITARADEPPSQWRITRYHVDAVVDRAGTTSVSLDVEFDFGTAKGHGPYLALPLRQRVDNPDLWRMLDTQVGAVTSSTGANSEVLIEEEDGVLLVRVGNESVTFTGRQQYSISYTVRGLIAPNHATSGLDEFNWNVVGPAWEVPISAITAKVTGPAAVQRTACFTGDSFDRPCSSDATHDAATATFAQDQVRPGQGVQIVAGFPPGTFVGAEPRFTKRFHLGNMVPVTPLTAGVTGALILAGMVVLLRATRRGARDQVYLGIAPGLRPAAGEPANVGAAVSAPVAVQFTPPRKATPGELGTLLDARADNVDVTATIIDLAVRGHLTITPQARKEWTFTATGAPAKSLTRAEKHVLKTLFQSGSQVTSRELKEKQYAKLLTGTRERLYERVTKELRWFVRDPGSVAAMMVVAGVGLILLGIAVGVALAFVGFGLVGLAGVVLGVALIVLHNKFGRRTAEGSAVLAQARGFELYLSTAEADQIRFEEGIDVFSRYLPYAIIFGVTDRWVKVFEKLAADGLYTADTGWYLGPTSGYYFPIGFVSSMNSLSTTMSSSMMSAATAASSGSSGGSGFSGGGGFGGGGGGGW